MSCTPFPNDFERSYRNPHGRAMIFKGGPTIDEMPLDATIGSARVIQIRDRKSIRREELIEHEIEASERVLFKTANSDNLWTKDEFDEDFIFIEKDGAEYLAERGVRVVGVDYLSVGGFRQDAVETHQALLGAGIWVIEGLNLSALNPEHMNWFACRFDSWAPRARRRAPSYGGSNESSCRFPEKEIAGSG